MESAIETTIRVQLTLDGQDVRQLLADLNSLVGSDYDLISLELPALRDLHARLKNYAQKFPARQEE